MSVMRWIGVAAALTVVTGGAYLGARWWGNAETVWADPDNIELVREGRAVYRGQCASCHGAELEGEANWRQRRPDGTLPAPPHDASGHTWHHSDEILFGITKHGGQRGAPPGFVSRMPGFAQTLSDREIHAVLAYIKSRWPEPVRERQALIDRRAR